MQFHPARAAGLARLAEFLPRAGRFYADHRNADEGAGAGDLARRNVSQLSPWLHAGLLGEAEVVDAVLGQHSPRAAEKFIAEVFWRIYFKGYLEQRPGVWASYVAGRDQALAALEGNAGLRKAYTQATEGRTGIAAFDHWARELAATGYL
ncbi:MAG: DNA photolyase, partial [Erythrobacter sp.]